ncbi:MAG: hypothetical protein WBQ75_01680 [Acetobacteraceae bacterium]
MQNIMRAGRVVLDDDFLILREYQNKTTPKTGNRAGDAFVRWVLRNRMNASRVDCVVLAAHDVRGFESFPDDEALSNFDAPDRKFVAVARVHPNAPTILQAADSKWLDWAGPLGTHGVIVDFLCPDDIARFRANKASE